MAKYVKLKTVWKMLHGLGGCGAEPESWADGWDKAIDRAIGELDKIPAADVQEVKRGRWVEDGCLVCCSVCGQRSIMDFETPYCQWCGAKMNLEVKNDKN